MKTIKLMTHVVVGYPDMEESQQLIEVLMKNSDFVELQIPFSDPVADGETIMKASETAIKNGMNTDRAFEMIYTLTSGLPRVANDVRLPRGKRNSMPSSSLSEHRHSHLFKKIQYSTKSMFNSFASGQTLRSLSRKIHVLKVHVPILIMCYYNQVFRYGVERFIKRAKEAGVVGLIVPDIPPDEEKNEQFLSVCNKYNLDSIRVISPLSSEERIRINSEVGKGFIYLVSHFGVTGAKSAFDKSLFEYISRVKRQTSLPLAVGFGISKREQVEALVGRADIAIVGSAIINEYDKKGIEGLKGFISHLKAGTIEK